MDLAAKDIKKLRQRLGWSLAEMARHMGCSVEILSSWEAGTQSVDPEGANQLRYLSTYIDSYNDKIAQLPLAEREMEDRMLSQLTHQSVSGIKNSN